LNIYLPPSARDISPPATSSMEARRGARKRKAEPMCIERNLSLDRYEVYLAEWAHGDYYKRQYLGSFDTRQEAEEYVRREGGLEVICVD